MSLFRASNAEVNDAVSDGCPAGVRPGGVPPCGAQRCGFPSGGAGPYDEQSSAAGYREIEARDGQSGAIQSGAIQSGAIQSGAIQSGATQSGATRAGEAAAHDAQDGGYRRIRNAGWTIPAPRTPYPDARCPATESSARPVAEGAAYPAAGHPSDQANEGPAYPATAGPNHPATGGPAGAPADGPVHALERTPYPEAEGPTERLVVTGAPGRPGESEPGRPRPGETEPGETEPGEAEQGRPQPGGESGSGEIESSATELDEAGADRSWLPTLTMIISVIALALAGGATVSAWQAIDTANRAAAMKHTPVAAPAALPSAGSPAVVSASAAIPSPAGYVMKYAQEPLLLTPRCGTSTLVDLDTHRADAPEPRGDLRYHNICSADGPLLGLGAGARAAAVVADADTDAPGCADAVRNGPLEEGDDVPVQKGTVLCVLTGTAGAAPVLALVEVTGLDATGRVSMRATAWSAAALPAATGAAPTGPPGSETGGATDGATDGAPDGATDGATDGPTDGATTEESPADAVPSDRAAPGG
jgi:hypothetical protein